MTMSKLKLLIVDDEEKTRNLIKICIDWNELGIEVAGEASSGMEALDFLENHNVDLIITDIIMPFMDGLEFSETALRRYPQVKIVVLTAHEEFEYAQRGIKLGIADFLLKPIKRAELRTVIGGVVDKLRQERVSRDEYEMLRRQLTENYEYLKEKFLNDLLREVYEYEEIREKLAYFAIPPLQQHVQIALIELSSHDNGAVSSEEETALLDLACVNLVRRYFQREAEAGATNVAGGDNEGDFGTTGAGSDRMEDNRKHGAFGLDHREGGFAEGGSDNCDYRNKSYGGAIPSDSLHETSANHVNGNEKDICLGNENHSSMGDRNVGSNGDALQEKTGGTGTGSNNISIFVDNSRRVVLLNASEEIGLTDCCEQLRSLLQSALACNVSIGIGNAYRDGEGNCKSLRKSYREAYEALKYKVVYGKNHVVCFKEINLSNENPDIRLDEIQEIGFYVKAGLYEPSAVIIDKIFEDLVNAGSYNLEKTRVIAVNIATAVLNAITELGLNYEDIVGKQNIPYNLVFRIDTIPEMRKYLSSFVQSSVHAINRARDCKTNHALKSILEFMQSNLGSSELSLSQVADAFYLNSSYLCRIFKQEMNKTFVEYLTQVRIERAIELLAQTNLKAYEICQQVGIPDPNYFGKCFKKYTGVSVNDYKKRNQTG